MTVELQLGELPLRVVAFPERNALRWEHEVQVDVGGGWERLFSFAPPRTAFPEDRALALAIELARERTPTFLPSWLARRAQRVAKEELARAAREEKRRVYEAAAPQRAAYLKFGLDELARRQEEKIQADEARDRLEHQ